MKNHWAIAIGINQYQCFQPLSYAQKDAEALHSFLISEAGFLPEQCLLLTDTSPPTATQPTYPNRENIQTCLERICREQLQPGDHLWFFFSGYGVNPDGADYLMPIEGNPEQIEATGISIQTIFNNLKAAPTPNQLVLLDINRSQGIRTVGTIGTQTAQLAQQMEIVTVLSCQANQFSRETSTLQHGFFTAALLESLRSQHGHILEKLGSYLSDRLPELSEQHWRPKQEPVLIIPTGQEQRVILPVPELAPTTENLPILVATLAGNSSQPFTELPITPPPISTNGATPIAPTPPVPVVTPTPIPVTTPAPIPPKKTPWLLWLSVFVLAFCGIMFALSKTGWLGQRQPEIVTEGNLPSTTESLSKPSTKPSTLSTTKTSPSKNLSLNLPPDRQNPLNQARVVLQGNPASHFSNAIKAARQIPPNSPLYAQAQQDINRWSQVILDIAQGRAEQGNFDLAIGAALLVPNDRSEIYQAAQQDLSVWQQQLQLQKERQKLLQTGKRLAQGELASSYSDAIFQARKIPPSDPLFKQAQENIDLWSRGILNIAKERALQGKFVAAIAAARLVPNDRPSVYQEAQQLIVTWQKPSQQQTFIALLQKAKDLAQGGQASAYNQAIAIASQIKDGQPKYSEAQQLIGQWSEKILAIAQQRAAQGQFLEAVEAALLVPENTPASGAAQSAITQWQQHLTK